MSQGLTPEQMRQGQLYAWSADNDQCHLVNEAFKKHFPNEEPTDHPTMIARILRAEFPNQQTGINLNPHPPAGEWPRPNSFE